MTPQRQFRRFLEGWKSGDYQKAYKVTQITWRENNSFDQFLKIEPFKLLDYEPKFKIVSKTPFVADVSVKVKGEGIGWLMITARLVREKGAYSPSKFGRWGVNPFSVIYKTLEGHGYEGIGARLGKKTYSVH